MVDVSVNGVPQPLDRPAILLIGSPSVGKRTILQHLVASSGCLEVNDEDASSSGLLRGWTIENKYYKADVAVWTVNLQEDKAFSVSSLPSPHRIAALVLIFDASQNSSLTAIQEWASATDTRRFDILLCVANKVDLLPTHPAHALYGARFSQDSLDDSYMQTTSLLSGDEIEDTLLQIRTCCLNWCTDRNFEYIEACASIPEFDKCLSADGDSQGVERIITALSAHMWPGMIMKSGNVNPRLFVPINGRSDSSEDESDYEFDYQALSEGSGDDTFREWTSADGNPSSGSRDEPEYKDREVLDGQECKSFVAATATPSDLGNGSGIIEQETSSLDLDNVELLLSEIGNARDTLRFMSDSHRREMAASLALKMASMFGDDSEDESEV